MHGATSLHSSQNQPVSLQTNMSDAKRNQSVYNQICLMPNEINQSQPNMSDAKQNQSVYNQICPIPNEISQSAPKYVRFQTKSVSLQPNYYVLFQTICYQPITKYAGFQTKSVAEQRGYNQIYNYAPLVTEMYLQHFALSNSAVSIFIYIFNLKR